ncbi:MAG: hypothetical protein ACTSXP_16220 [Promethearchaeota archaeon]
MVVVKKLIEIVKNVYTREQAKDLVKLYLSRYGWLTIERNEFDVYAVKTGNPRLIIKFWIQPIKKPVPKFYIKRFDQDVEKYAKESQSQSFMQSFFITNCALSKEAYEYYKLYGRFNMKLLFTANDIKSQIIKLNMDKRLKVTKFAQKQLLEFIPAM